MRHHRRLLLLAILSLISAGIASGAISQASAKGKSSPVAHAAASYQTGIGDEQPEMFGNPLWTQLHTKIARYIAPYDAATRPFSLGGCSSPSVSLAIRSSSSGADGASPGSRQAT